jgi:hypothetical protein
MKKDIVVVDRDDAAKDVLFWKNKTPEERLNAVELLREQYYVIQGYKDIPRIERVIRIVERVK